MPKRALFIIPAFVLLVFLNTLRSGFIADDEFVIVQNDFYTSFANLKNLFTENYFLKSNEALSHGFHNLDASGSVAYRPVLSLTYFIDYALWHLNPFGYHLTNVLWHALTAVLVYLCFWQIFRKEATALLGALIFAAHPFVSETVSCIGFRADLVATALVLAAFYGYLTGRRVLSLIFFFFALFAKESAVVFPGLVFLYETFGAQKNERKPPYVGYLLVLVFYLWVYFFVFPNQAMHEARWMGGYFKTHVLSALYILSYYVSGFFNPLFVRVLPPVTAPVISHLKPIEWAMAFGSVLGILGWWGYAAGRRKKEAFFLGWFLVALLPVSNIIPLLNPWANRYMYLPIIGLCGLLALLIEGLRGVSSLNWVKIIRLCFISLCVFLTVPMNMSYYNNFMLASSLVEDNPENPMGYLFMALNYVKVGDLKKAKDLVELGQARGLDDPRGLYILGWYYRKDLPKQHEIFNDCVRRFPSYNKGDLALARAYLLEGHLPQAARYARQSLAIQPTFHGYHYLMQVKIMQGKKNEAEALWEEAQKKLKNKNLSNALHDLLVTAKPGKLPLDIGF